VERLVLRWRKRCSRCVRWVEPGQVVAWSPISKRIVCRACQLAKVGDWSKLAEAKR
jgi:hypothetical protein